MYMMLMPKNNLDLFDDIFGGNFLSKVDNNMMRTDIRESDDEYLIDVDLPGYSKENIKVDVTDGYLNINAKMNDSHDEKEKGKYVRRERYYGECSRSFYIGDDIKKEDIKASFKDGILCLNVPKKTQEDKEAERNYISID